jgi:uncharacterized membrane protein
MLDKFGISAASLCALHCILLPILIPILPLFGLNILADHWWEHPFLAISAAIGFIALFSAYKKYHQRLYPLLILFLGIFIYWQKHDFSEQYQLYIVIIGTTLIVSAHVINIKLCNKYRKCKTRQCAER